MKLYKVGEKSKAICEDCKAIVATTFAYKEVPFDDGSGSVKDILVSVCDECECIVAIPAQSTPAIKRAREASDITLEVKLPASDLEILDYAAFIVDENASTKFRKPLIAFYLKLILDSPELIGKLPGFKPAIGKNVKDKVVIPKRRLSLKLSPETDANMKKAMAIRAMTKTKLIRSIIRDVDADIVDTNKPKHLKVLRDIASALSS